MDRTGARALDDLCSLAASPARKKRALDQLELVVADACAPSNNNSRLVSFLGSQDSFDGNIASRVMTFLAFSLSALQNPDDKLGPQDSMYACVAQSMSLIQGVALLHASSKALLGSRWAIELFLALLVCPQPGTSGDLASGSPSKLSTPNLHGSPSLHIAIVEALLCILVDAPLAIRSFEELKGLEVIVKCLKMAHLPKDVRIKCLEFLYWYLLPEDVPPQRTPAGSSIPSTPVKKNAVPLPLTTSLPVTTSQPTHTPVVQDIKIPSRSPTKPSRTAMLRRDLEFVPTTPKKAHSRLDMETPHATSRSAPNNSPPFSPAKRTVIPSNTRSEVRTHSRSSENIFLAPPAVYQVRDIKPLYRTTRSTEEKKALLGDLLGNVDVLVESVCKAGIWGLG
ncbi:cell division protein Cdc14 [Auriculariales sp. MPI-PUGE-AT-0066]|nr:cell division protein Cdc14 [Auriculariales sp. MPI-PUGE-AT-0066]